MTAKPEEKPAEARTALLKPYDGARVVLQRFGDNAEVYGRFGQKGHNGIDIGLPGMQPVKASHDGVVEFAGDGGEWPVMGSAAGICVLLKSSELKIRTGYAHLSMVYVNTGDQVKAGDVIGLSGMTGAAAGYHLHFEVLPMPLNLKNGYYGRTDPTPYMSTATPVEGTPTPVDTEGGL